MPEYVEYVWFACFLEVWSLIIGPIIVYSQRSWPSNTPANASPNSSQRLASEELQSIFTSLPGFYVHWFPSDKFLIAECSSLCGAVRAWIKMSLGICGYPMIVVCTCGDL